MITSTIYRPTRTSTPYNPIVWSVASDKTGQPDFQYVIDVYVNDVIVTRLKQRPNPAGYGMWDVSTIVQPYLKLTNFTQGELESGDSAADWYHTNEEASVHVYCRVGEQYGLNSVIYVGTTNTVGNPSYPVYAAYDLIDLQVTVIGGSLPDHKSLWNMQNPITNGIWTQDPFNLDRHYEWKAGLAMPLSMVGSSTRKVYEFDKSTLSFLNFSADETTYGTIYGFRFKLYPAAVGPVPPAEDVPLLVSTGFGPYTNCDDPAIVGQPASLYDIVNINTSAQHIAALTGWDILPGDRYSIQGFTALPEDCTFTSAITEEIFYKVEEYCETLYPRVRLSWLNELAGRDYFNFTMLAEKTIGTAYETYAQNQINWSSFNPVPQLGSTYPPFGNLPIRGGNKTYNKTATTTWTITTDWLGQEEVNLLESLQKSPQVLAYIHDSANGITDYFPYSCRVTNSSYTNKLVKQAKLTAITFTIEVNIPQSLQNT